MTALIAPRGQLWSQKDASYSLSQINLSLLEMGRLLHELVSGRALQNGIKHCVHSRDEVISVACLEDLH